MAYIGEIILLANGRQLDAGSGVLPCDGKEYFCSDFSALSIVIGATYGGTANGDGFSGTFRVPNIPRPAGLQAPAAYYICTNGDYPIGSAAGDMVPHLGRVAQFSFALPSGDPPPEYLYCDGTLWQANLYPDLAQVLSGSYGSAPEGAFVLPKVPASASTVVTAPPNAGYCITKVGETIQVWDNDFIGQIVLLPTPTGPGILSGKLSLSDVNGGTLAWACNGQLISIQQNMALVSVIGTTYGGDGRNTFAVPNLPPPPGLEHHSYFIVNEGMYPSDAEGGPMLPT